MRARNDLLARKATLREADCVEQVEVQHLCDELTAGSLRDLRQAAGDVRELPAFPDCGVGLSRKASRVGADVGAGREGRIARCEQHTTRRPAEGRTCVCLDRLQCIAGHQRARVDLDLDLRPKHVSTQPVAQCGHEVDRRHGVDCVARLPQPEHRDHASLRAVARREHRAAVLEQADVVRDLALEERDGVAAGESQQTGHLRRHGRSRRFDVCHHRHSTAGSDRTVGTPMRAASTRRNPNLPLVSRW
jgi:hypothetical protein